MLAVGPGGFDKDGKRIACGVAVGDKVLIPQVGSSVGPLFLIEGRQVDMMHIGIFEKRIRGFVDDA